MANAGAVLEITAAGRLAWAECCASATHVVCPFTLLPLPSLTSASLQLRTAL